jgi:hypothetical protein
MFPTICYNAVSVTKHSIVFCCPEFVNSNHYVRFNVIPSDIDEIEEPRIIRRFNRIQSSVSKKTRTSIGINMNSKDYRNRREYEHRSKELFVQKRFSIN